MGKSCTFFWLDYAWYYETTHVVFGGYLLLADKSLLVRGVVGVF